MPSLLLIVTFEYTHTHTRSLSLTQHTHAHTRACAHTHTHIYIYIYTDLAVDSSPPHNFFLLYTLNLLIMKRKVKCKVLSVIFVASILSTCKMGVTEFLSFFFFSIFSLKVDVKILRPINDYFKIVYIYIYIYIYIFIYIYSTFICSSINDVSKWEILCSWHTLVLIFLSDITFPFWFDIYLTCWFFYISLILCFSIRQSVFPMSLCLSVSLSVSLSLSVFFPGFWEKSSNLHKSN